MWIAVQEDTPRVMERHQTQNILSLGFFCCLTQVLVSMATQVVTTCSPVQLSNSGTSVSLGKRDALEGCMGETLLLGSSPNFCQFTGKFGSSFLHPSSAAGTLGTSVPPNQFMGCLRWSQGH